MHILRVEKPLLWVEYDGFDETLEEGDVVASIHGVFQIELVIRLQSDGVIISLKETRGDGYWPYARESIRFTKVF